jgi:acetylornithine deacetylase/succinyl-diaminopimelate desuccinylase-like protein
VNQLDTLRSPPLDSASVLRFCEQRWDEEVIPALSRYITIPAKSPAFDPDWERNGHLDRVVRDAATWAETQGIDNLILNIIRLPNRTPLIHFEVPSSRPTDCGAALFYGHLDKQPEFDGWRTGLGPWTPVNDGTRLYGRGGADDGYAIYAALTAVRALQAQKIAHPRCIGIIETSEESGSPDLPHYLEVLAQSIRDVALVVCLDSGAGSYDRLWNCTSLRGFASGTLEVQVLEEGVHAGDASGIVPSSFRILRNALDRIEESGTGRITAGRLYVDIPLDRIAQARATAQVLGADLWKRFKWHCGEGDSILPVTSDPEQALLNRSWRPAMTVTGAEGLPAISKAGGVMLPRTAFKLSFRLPPGVDARAAILEIQNVLEAKPLYGAAVKFRPDPTSVDGWNAPPMQAWLESALNTASAAYFGLPCSHIGQGGTIPLMPILQRAFHSAQFLVCGVLGPESNAHGPNEFLHIPYAKKLTASLVTVLADMGARSCRVDDSLIDGEKSK